MRRAPSSLGGCGSSTPDPGGRLVGAEAIRKAAQRVADAWRAARCPVLWELGCEDPASTSPAAGIGAVYSDRVRALGAATFELTREVHYAGRPELEAALKTVLDLCGTFLAAVSIRTAGLDHESEGMLGVEQRAMVDAAVRAAPDEGDQLSLRMRAALDEVDQVCA